MSELEKIIKDAERFIHKTAWALQRKNDVLLSYDELVGEGYLVLAKHINRWEEGKRFPFYYFGKRLWFDLLVKVKRLEPAAEVTIDITDVVEQLGEDCFVDLFASFGLKHLMEMIPDDHRRVVIAYVDPPVKLAVYARQNRLRLATPTLISRFFGMKLNEVEEILGNFRLVAAQQLTEA